METEKPERLSERVVLVRANNPGPMTLTGTNSYLVGRGSEVAVIDPGPSMPEHLQALIEAAKAQQASINLILVTHGHPDHYPGAAELHNITGAPVAAFKEAEFAHDLTLNDGQRLRVGDSTLITLFTPGHAHDHLCFYLEEEDALFTGDLILGTGTTVVAPPKGDMNAYFRSLFQLDQDWSQAEVIYPGHGPAITNPSDKIREYIKHRQQREQQVLQAIGGGTSTVSQIVTQIYADVDKRLWPAAARQVLAHLAKLEAENKISVTTAEMSADDVALLRPSGVFDPVVAAELGFGTEPTEAKYRYQLA